MSLMLIAQLVGVVAVLFSLSIFQQNKRLTMLKLATIAALLFSVQFFMLGALTGAVINLLAAGRCFVFYKVNPTNKNQWILWVFVTVTVVATILTWHGPVSLLAMLGSICTAVASWHKEPKVIRRFFMAAPPLWFTYDALVGSYPGMFIEVANFASNLVGQYRFDLRHKSHLRRKMAHPH